MPPSCQYLAMWDSRGGLHGFKRWPPPYMWCNTLFCVTLNSTYLLPDADMTVRIMGTLFRVALNFTHFLPDASMIVHITGILDNKNADSDQ